MLKDISTNMLKNHLQIFKKTYPFPRVSKNLHTSPSPVHIKAGKCLEKIRKYGRYRRVEVKENKKISITIFAARIMPSFELNNRVLYKFRYRLY